MTHQNPSRPVVEGAAATRCRAVDSNAQHNRQPSEAQGARRTLPLCPSEDALALLFAERHEGTLRHVQQTSPYKWFVLIDGVWIADNTNHVLDLVRAHCRECAADCDDPALARSICSAMSISAVERLARTDRRLAATKDMLGLGVQSKSRKRGAKAEDVDVS
jgi:hypothetical protein